MFKLILFKELLEITKSTKFAITFGICSILIILAFFIGIYNYRMGMLEYNASKAAQLQKFETFSHWSQVRNHQVNIPPKPLSYLVMGVSNDIGRTALIDGRNKPNISNSFYNEQTVFAVFRFLDLEFVFQIILSLLAILFAFDAINGEKERGTLRLSFSNAISRAIYILGKIAGSFLALALPLLIPVLIGILLLLVMGISLSYDEWICLGLFIICGLLYIGVFLTLSIFMSCLTKRSSSSFLFLLVIWVCSVFIFPRASILIAGNMIKVPSSAEINYQITQLGKQNSREMIEQINKASAKFSQEVGESQDSNPEVRKKIEKKLDDLFKKINAQNNKKTKDLADCLSEERRNKEKKQEKLALTMSRVSPTAVFTLVATTLCRTSIELRYLFQKNASTYSQSFKEFIHEKTGSNIGNELFSAQEGIKSAVRPVNPGEIPEFIYQSPELADIIHDSLPDITLLLLFNMIFFFGAFLVFLRFDLR